jgi:hypothetical protein
MNHIATDAELIAAIDASDDFITVTDSAHLAELLGIDQPEPEQNLTIQGVTDEQTTCDRCGRIELRRTCIIVDTIAGVEVGRYGTSCASKILGRKVAAKDADRIERERRHNLRCAKIDLARGVKTGDENMITMAIEDIERFWIKGAESMHRLIDNMKNAS